MSAPKLIRLDELIAKLTAIRAVEGNLPVFSHGEFITLPQLQHVYEGGFEWLENDLGDEPQIFPAGEKAVLI